MLCALILYVSGGTYSLTSTPNDRFFMAVLYTLRIFARNLLRESRRRNIFLFYFIFDDWPGIRTQAFGSNKPTHYLLDHGDFEFIFDSKFENKVLFYSFEKLFSIRKNSRHVTMSKMLCKVYKLCVYRLRISPDFEIIEIHYQNSCCLGNVFQYFTT